MTIYKTTDETGAESIHNCQNEIQAEQVHLLHFGIMSCGKIEVTIVKSKNICKNRDCINLINQMKLERFGRLC